MEIPLRILSKPVAHLASNPNDWVANQSAVGVSYINEDPIPLYGLRGLLKVASESYVTVQGKSCALLCAVSLDCLIFKIG